MADDFKENEVGGRYAQALFELALDQGALDTVRADLTSFKALILESSDFRRLLSSPAYQAEDKQKGLLALADKLGVSALTRKALGLLATNRRADALSALIAGFEARHDKHLGIVVADVVSAVALTDTQAKAVAEALKSAFGKDAKITARVDPAILGGLKVRVGSRLFDASVKTKIDSLKFALKRA